MKYCDIIKTIKNITSTTSSGYTPTKDTDLVNKKYVDDSIESSTANGSVNLDEYPKKSELATVATSGSYNDLTNTPTIPSIDGLATEAYVDSKFIQDEILFESDINDTITETTYNEKAAYLFDIKLDVKSNIEDLIFELKSDQPSSFHFPNFVYDETVGAYKAHLNENGSEDEYDIVYLANNESGNLLIIYEDEFLNQGFWKHVKLYKPDEFTTKSYVDDSIAAIPEPDFTGLATEAYVDNKVSSLVNSAPEALDTLKELSDALGGDANFATTVSQQIGEKADKTQLADYALKTELHSHDNKTILDGITDTKVTEWDNKSTFSGSYNDLTNKPTIPTVTNDLTNELKANYDNAYTHSQSTHFDGDYNSLTNKPTIPSIDGLATEAYVNDKVSQKLIGISYSGDIFLTNDEYQYLTNINDSSGIFVFHPSVDNFAQIHVILSNSTYTPVFGDVTVWKDNNYYGGVNDIDVNNIYEYIFTYIKNIGWIGEVIIYTTQEQEKIATEAYVDNKLSNLSIVQITQAEYDALTTKDPNVLYLITE